MKRLVRLSAIDIQHLEEEYLKMIERCKKQQYSKEEEPSYKLEPVVDNDKKTFLISPQNLIEYDDNMTNIMPRPGIPGLWSDSMRWIGR